MADGLDLTGYAADSDIKPTHAGRSVSLANQTGLDPQYVSDNYQEVQLQRERAELTTSVGGRPALQQWAQQSQVHAAAVRDDGPILGRIEGWLGGMGDAFKYGLADVWQNEAMRERMGSGGPLASRAFDAEDEVQKYESKPHTVGEDIVRAAPQMGIYAGLGFLTGGVGTAALMYAQNKGALARSIQQAQPGPVEDTRPLKVVNGKLTRIGPEPEQAGLTDDEVDNYATAGSAAAAVTLAGLMTPLLRTLPGVKEGAARLSAGVLTRAVSTTMGQAVVSGLAAYGKHTLMGAVGMALQHVINEGTVQKATDGSVDLGQLTQDGTKAFLKSLPVAAAFAAYGPGKDFLEDRGRIIEARADSAKMDELTRLANASKFAQRHPDLATELFGLMGRGATAYVDYRAARKLQESNYTIVPDHEVAEAEASEGSVAVPLSDYLAHASKEHEAIAQDVKLDPNGFTPREADERLAQMPEEVHPLLPEDEIHELGPDDEVTGEPPKVPEDASATQESAPLHEAMAKEYGGTPEEWTKLLSNPQVAELLSSINEQGSVGSISPEESAARTIEAMRIGTIDPKPYQRLAAKKSKDIQRVAEQSVTGSVAGAPKSSPSDVAQLQMHEMTRDLNLAKAKKAELVKTEMGKSLQNLSDLAVNQNLRTRLYKAGPPLLHLFDSLTEGTEASPVKQGWADAHNEAISKKMAPGSAEAQQYADARMANALDESLQWMDINNPVARDQTEVDALKQYLSNPKPFSELIPAQARIITDMVKQLRVMSAEAVTIQDGKNKVQLEAKVAEARAELQQNPSKGLPQLAGAPPPSTWERMQLAANGANALMLRLKNNLRQVSTTLERLIHDRLNDADYYRNDLANKYEPALGSESMPADVAARRYEQYDLSKFLPTDHLGVQPLKSMPRQFLYELASHYMSSGNMDRVISTSGWSLPVIRGLLFDNADTKLTRGEWDYLQSQADVREKMWQDDISPRIEQLSGRPAQKKVMGNPFTVDFDDGTSRDYAGGYKPLKRDARPGVAPQAEPTTGIAAYYGKDFQIPWTPGSVKDRLDSSHYLVNLDYDTNRAYTSSILHWVAYDPAVRDVAKLLNDTKLRADMNQYMGENRASMVETVLRSAATRQADSVPKGMEMVAKAFGWQRRLALMGIVGDSFRLAAAQISHPFGLMLGGQINPVYGVPALLSTFKPFGGDSGGDVGLMPNWGDALDHSKELQRRADNSFNSLQQQMSQIGQAGNVGPMGKLLGIAKATAGFQLHAVDRLTSTWAWVAAHNEAVGKLKLEPYSPEAVKYADGKTFDVMPQHGLLGAAPVLTNRQIGGFLIMHGFKNTLYNMRADAVNSTRLDFYKADGAGQTTGAVASMVGRIGLQMAMYGGFALMGKTLLGVGQEDGESKADWVMRDALGGQTTDLPIIGSLGEPLAKYLVHGTASRRDFSIYNSPGISAVNHITDLLGNMVSENREPDKKLFDVMETAAYLGGLPSRPLRTAGEHLYQMLTGEDSEDSPEFGRLLYSEKQWASVKRTLSPDED